jgi:CubicO group peptidase (beta-lactamase class C family)
MTSRRPARWSALAALAAATALLAVAAPQAAAQMSRAERIAVMDSIAGSPVLEGRVAGLAVAVVQGSDTLLFKSYGKADLEWDVPMPVDAVFEIGSVTKQFTAAAAVRLRDEGKLDLDADLTDYLSDFPTQGHRIPVRRLLDHTSGMKGATEIAGFRALRGQDLPRDSAVSLIAAEPFDFAPGEALIYNNSGYILLGHIIEQVSGMSYEEYVEKELFARLGMHRSSYCSNTEVVPRRARGYQLTADGLMRREHVSHVWPYSAGSLCSTTGDLVTWLHALHGGRLLAEASYQDMITPVPLNDGTPVRYAMGLVRTPDTRGRPAIHHGGAISGFLSETRYYPDDDLVVVMLVNTTGNLSPAALATELVDVLLPRVPIERRRFEGDAEPLVGTYAGRARGQQLSVTVTRTADGLAAALAGGRQAPLFWVGGWTFGLGPIQTVTFARERGDGPATVMRLDGGGSHYVLRRQPD